MANHIIKYEYLNGMKLPKHKIQTWCGHKPQFADWLFQDAQHALLSVEQCSRIEVCKKCLNEIIKLAQTEVQNAN